MKELTRITFINSGGFEYQYINLPSDTMLSGMNNSGKTTILRAVVIGQTGELRNLGFTGNESFAYYLSHNGSPGFLAIDYKDDIGNYCILFMAPTGTTTTEMHIIDAAFDYRWVMADQEQYFTRWNPIHKNIEILSGARTLRIRDEKHLKDIINGKETDPSYLRYSFSKGTKAKKGSHSAVLSSLLSLWLNKKLSGDDFKRILLDRIRETDAENTQDYNIAEYKKNAAVFNDSFEGYLLHTTGQLDAPIENVKKNFRNYKEYQKKDYAFPGYIKGIRQSLLSFSESIGRKILDAQTGYENKKLEYQTESGKYEEASIKRREIIGAAKANIKRIKEGWERIQNRKGDEDAVGLSKKSWYEQLLWWEKLDATIGIAKHFSDKIKRLENEINILEQKGEKAVDALERERLSTLSAIDESIKNLASEMESIHTEHDQDQRLHRTTIAATENDIRETVTSQFKERIDKLYNLKQEAERKYLNANEAKRFFSRKAQEKDLEENIEARLKESNIISTELLAPIRNILMKIISSLLTDFFGYDPFSRNADKEIEALKEKFESAEKELETLLAKRTKEIEQKIKKYNENIQEIEKSYNLRIAKCKDLEKRHRKERKDKEDWYEGKKMELLKEAGVDVNEIKKLKKELSDTEALQEYHDKNSLKIIEGLNLIREYGNINILENDLSGKEQEDKDFCFSERTALAEKKKELESIAKDISTLKEARNEKMKDLKAYEDNLTCFALRFGLETEMLKSDIENAEALFIQEEGNSPLSQAFDNWTQLKKDMSFSMNALRAYILQIKDMLKGKDVYNFSIGPEDDMSSDKDFLRIADNIDERSNPNGRENMWERDKIRKAGYSTLMRTFLAIYDCPSFFDKAEKEVKKIQTFLNKHNKCHSIKNVEFEIERSENVPFLKTAKRFYQIAKDNGIDLYTANLSDEYGTELFDEDIDAEVREKLIEVLKECSRQIVEYKSDILPLDEYFDIRITVTEAETGKSVSHYDVTEFGSTGTGNSLKILLSLCLVASNIGNPENNEIKYAVVTDEFDKIDTSNQKALRQVANALNLKIVTAAPSASGYDNIYEISTAEKTREIINCIAPDEEI